MRSVFKVLLALFAVAFLADQAKAEPVLSIVFSGNSWGYLKPCPT
ncbi:MAG: hypothetical protein ACLGSA_03055 [Acidobacteriota bacterium]